MENTTLGYIEKDGCWLMIHRTKKEKDISKDKWLGVGGKMEANETVLECMQRETLEETGLYWNDPALKALITFNFYTDKEEPEYTELMFLFTGSDFEGEMKECKEGDLEWVPMEKVKDLPIWKGDLLFMEKMMENGPLFYMNLSYRYDQLIYASMDGEEIDLSGF